MTRKITKNGATLHSGGVTCHTCGGTWDPEQAAEDLPSRWWACPKGCNKLGGPYTITVDLEDLASLVGVGGRVQRSRWSGKKLKGNEAMRVDDEAAFLRLYDAVLAHENYADLFEYENPVTAANTRLWQRFEDTASDEHLDEDEERRSTMTYEPTRGGHAPRPPTHHVLRVRRDR